MIRRRRSPFRYLVPALLVGGLLWWAHTWFSRRAEPLPKGQIDAVADTLADAYAQLSADFRAKVPTGEFAAMFHRMADPDGEDLPVIRQAVAFEATGPEPPRARFRVDYEPTKAHAEYHFARIEGIWKLQSFTRALGDWQPPVAMARTPAPPAPAPATSTRVVPVGPAPGTSLAPAAPPQPTQKFPCYYIIQSGDTLSSVSRHFYGTTVHWRHILEANPGLKPRTLRIGLRILVPSPPDHRPPRPSGPAAATADDGAR